MRSRFATKSAITGDSSGSFMTAMFNWASSYRDIRRTSAIFASSVSRQDARAITSADARPAAPPARAELAHRAAAPAAVELPAAALALVDGAAPVDASAPGVALAARPPA